MHIQMLTSVIALIREVLNQPGVKKYNTKKNRVKNILMISFLLMFLGFSIMTEQAILQSNAKYVIQDKIALQNKLINELERDLYLKDLSESPIDNLPHKDSRE